MVRIVQIAADTDEFERAAIINSARINIANAILSNAHIGATDTLSITFTVRKRRNRNKNPLDTFVIVGNVII